MSLEHTNECLQTELGLRDWQLKFPDHCTDCNGMAYFHYAGSFDEPPSSDPCSNCIEQGKCPRCMKDGDILTDYQGMGDMLVCPSCGWDERIIFPDGQTITNPNDENGQPMFPPMWECYCYFTACSVCGKQMSEEEFDWWRKKGIPFDDWPQACAEHREATLAKYTHIEETG